MAIKSTHSGHCQACGHLQKLPGGTLAKHGYTVAFGYFRGVCRGAHVLPYEQSCDLIKTFIAEAQAEIDALTAMRDTWLAAATEAKAWVRCYIPATWQVRHSSYTWRYLPITFLPFDHDATRGRYVYPAQPESRNDNEFNRTIGTGPAEGLLTACTAQNAGYAAVIQRQINDLDRYITWQTKRVTDWTLTECLPNDAKKDKAGFVPAEIDAVDNGTAVR